MKVDYIICHKVFKLAFTKLNDRNFKEVNNKYVKTNRLYDR